MYRYNSNWYNNYSGKANGASLSKAALYEYEDVPDFGFEIYPDKDEQPKELSDVMHSIELITSIRDENYEFFSDRDVSMLDKMLDELTNKCDDLQDWLSANKSQEKLPF